MRYVLFVFLLFYHPAFGQETDTTWESVLPCGFDVQISTTCLSGGNYLDTSANRQYAGADGAYPFTMQGGVFSFSGSFWNYAAVKIMYRTSVKGSVFYHRALPISEGGAFEMKIFHRRNNKWYPKAQTDENVPEYPAYIEIAPHPIDSTMDRMPVNGDYNKSDTGLYRVRLQYKVKCGARIADKKTNFAYFRLVK